MLNESAIQAALQEAGIHYRENSSIYGIVMPKTSHYFLLGAFASFNSKYYILHFGDEAISILPISAMGKIKVSEIQRIYRKDITGMFFLYSLFHHVLCIKLSDRTLKFRVNKSVLGQPWHKRNLQLMLA